MVTQTANPAATPNAPANVAAIATDITNANQASSEAVVIDSAKGAAAAPAGGTAAAAPKPVLPVSPWKFALAANANYTDAADKQLDFRVAGGAVYEIKDVEKWKLDAEYFF